MPVYTNSGDSVRYSADPFVMFSPGDTTTDFYIRALPTDVTLKSHSPLVSPWVKLAAGQDSLYQVYPYVELVIYNQSNAAAVISANTDDTNAFSIPSGVRETLSNVNSKFGCLKVLSKGTGDVLIYALVQ